MVGVASLAPHYLTFVTGWGNFWYLQYAPYEQGQISAYAIWPVSGRRRPHHDDLGKPGPFFLCYSVLAMTRLQFSIFEPSSGRRCL